MNFIKNKNTYIMASHMREPIKHTCPDIDRYIKAIKEVIYSDRVYDVASNMAYELERCIDYLEELRESNDKLRQWGIEEADEVDELELKISELEQKPERVKE